MDWLFFTAVVALWMLIVASAIYGYLLRRRAYVLWQVISSKTDAELREQGMPYFAGLHDAVDEWVDWAKTGPNNPAWTKALMSTNPRTDPALAGCIARLRLVSRVLTICVSVWLLSILLLVMSSAIVRG